MRHYSFELHIVLTKAGEQPVHMTKRVMDIYMFVIVEIAFNMAKSYIDSGWSISNIETKDFVFLSSDTLTWYD